MLLRKRRTHTHTQKHTRKEAAAQAALQNQTLKVTATLRESLPAKTAALTVVHLHTLQSHTHASNHQISHTPQITAQVTRKHMQLYKITTYLRNPYHVLDSQNKATVKFTRCQLACKKHGCRWDTHQRPKTCTLSGSGPTPQPSS